MVLVTGATGLVGGNLMWYLLQENERVTAIYRPSSNRNIINKIFGFYTANPDPFFSRIDWIIADVLDFESIKKAMTNAIFVYHCAAIVSLGKNNNNILDTNVEGTKNVVRAALENNIEKLCFVSSIAACGEIRNSGVVAENGVWKYTNDKSIYAQSKYYSEQEVWKGINSGLNAVIVNPGVILGFSGNDLGSSQIFSRVRNGLIFYTNGGSGYVDAQDVAKVMIELTKSNISGEQFILVSQNCTNKQILNWIADGFGKRRPFISIGGKTLQFIGFLLEIGGKMVGFTPLIDRGTAKSITNIEYYSSEKIKDKIGFEFKSIEKCINQVCGYQLGK